MPTRVMPLRAVMFDFDGVLVDTEPLHLEAYQEILAGHGLSLAASDYYANYLGFDDEGVFRALSAAVGAGWSASDIAALVGQKAQRFAALLGDRDVLYPGASAVVHRLAAAVPLAIVSGALRVEIEAVLERARLRACFQAIVAAGETPRGKPAPDPYARGVALLKPLVPVPASSTTGRGKVHADDEGFVAVEDSRWGIESAHAAGLSCVAVAQTYGPSELKGADLIVSSLQDLTLDALRDLCDKGT